MSRFIEKNKANLLVVFDEQWMY